MTGRWLAYRDVPRGRSIRSKRRPSGRTAMRRRAPAAMPIAGGKQRELRARSPAGTARGKAAAPCGRFEVRDAALSWRSPFREKAARTGSPQKPFEPARFELGNAASQRREAVVAPAL